MAYFPMFTDLDGQPCVIVGGGRVALRKAEKLLPFGAEITVIAPEILPEIQRLPVTCIQRIYSENDLAEAFLVIAATNDSAVNRGIFTYCKARRIPVNAVDDPANCTFLFPALVREPPVTVGICTGGQSPVFAKYLRMLIEDALDSRTMDICAILCRYTPAVRKQFDTEKHRKEALDAILDLCLLEGDLPDDAEISVLLEKIYENQNRNTGQ